MLCCALSGAGVAATAPGDTDLPNDGRAERLRALLAESRQQDPVDPQAMVDAARPGATVTIPPGRYAHGLVISRPMTLNLEGVRLEGVARRKGILVVEGAAGPVVINNFEADGAAAGADHGNIAGVRVSGRAFDVSLNRAHIRGTAMGILTDNRGGVLRVVDSVVEDIGRESSGQSLSHAVYAGAIDRLEISDSTIRRSHNLGHLVKSRARVTLISRSHLAGEYSRHSRIIDLSCGGDLRVSDSYLGRSQRSDNRDLIGIGLEAGNGCGTRDGAAVVQLTGTVVTAGSADDEADATTYLFNWPTPMGGLTLRNNVYPLDGAAFQGQMSASGARIPLEPSGDTAGPAD